MKIIVEIDGIRHRLVHGRNKKSPCYDCSLERVCSKYIGSPCLRAGDYFKLDKEKFVTIETEEFYNNQLEPISGRDI